MSEDKIEAIGKIGSTGGKIKKVHMPNQDHFEALMQQGQTDQTKQVEATKTNPVEETRLPSLEDEVRNLGRRVDHASTRSPEALVAQAEDIIAKLGEIKEKLEMPDVQIKKDYQRQLQSKLQHIDENLKVALDKAGVEYQVPEAKPTLMNPIDRFLGFLTNGEAQLETLAGEVRGWHENREEMSPAGMLVVQVKVMQIQNQLELFTNLLNKSLESTKTIMNVQV